jgi:hypothetical protein
LKEQFINTVLEETTEKVVQIESKSWANIIHKKQKVEEKEELNPGGFFLNFDDNKQEVSKPKTKQPGGYDCQSKANDYLQLDKE